ncbi:NADPH:quinone reductase [Leifsonia shinshuensis]|uniref:NADPH:quinone reductase n=1 Tax=Leifsonia shinshuensis TaxID=150026 RepID=UPI001F511623|nr:NADPH:quinone reductase [Leifsonia shinshuensis]MCI0156780.1 NADPH:quinone reductase [Leifsonia shinshuensis]
MKAVSYSSTGDSDVLTLGERPEPHAGEGQVRVRIHVSGVNPTDWKSRQGSGPTELPRPQVPNQDGAGVVDEVGPGVSGLAPGDRVWVWDAAYQRPDGTAQELVVLPRDQVVALPDDVGFDVGASLGIPALTAHRALTSSESAPLELAPGTLEGLTVLVAGGAGAVGHAAIQLAVWAGATVIATVSSHEKAELARAAGAHHVVDYREPDTAEAIGALAPRGVDIVVEVNVSANAELDTRIAGRNATIASYADAPGSAEVTIPIRPSMQKNLRWQFLLTYTVSPEAKAAAVRAVAAAAAAGALPVGAEHGLPITRFPLEQTAAAHDAVKNGIVGKVLIDLT